MSTQANVHSIEALKDLRTALALFADDVAAALGAVDMEVRRTIQWLQHDRRNYWQEQVKRRREQVSMAKADVFRKKLAKTADYTPAHSEQTEILRQSEASLRDAELRVTMVKKWEPALQQAILEYHGSTRRIKDLASGDIPRGLIVLERMIDALEAYLREAPPSGSVRPSPFESIANEMLADGSIGLETERGSGQGTDASPSGDTLVAPPASPILPDHPEPPA
jgi:hypothetical protein